MHDGTNIPSDRCDPQNQSSDLDERLDEALDLTFPASDPIALSFDGLRARRSHHRRRAKYAEPASGIGVDQEGVQP